MLGRRAAIRGQRLLVLRQCRQTGRSVGRWRRIVILYSQINILCEWRGNAFDSARSQLWRMRLRTRAIARGHRMAAYVPILGPAALASSHPVFPLPSLSPESIPEYAGSDPNL